MATINFLYRSTKENAFLHLRLLYRYNDTDFVFGANTKYEVSKEYWSKQHTKKTKDAELVTKQADITKELDNIKTHILNAFNKINPDEVNKNWLQTQIDLYYNPIKVIEVLPTELIDYIDKYKEFKRNEVTESTIKKCNVVKQLLKRYQSSINKTLLITDIDTDFKTSFQNYCVTQNYAPNTISRTIRFIKTICIHAKSKKENVNPDLYNIKVKYFKVDSIHLTFDELEKIENIKKNKLTESLENTKDWLIISCYTGQRVSDFLRFTNDMIRIEDGKSFIEFTQKKTDKIMTVPLHPKVIEILKKRNGMFPYAISDQKYNDYIKTVCEIAEITQMVHGSMKTETAPESGIYRKETKMFKKCDLVTSHIGRRSFASNFYGTIPTSLLKNITGHSTESMFLTYIGKSNKDLAKETHKYF
ncbi:phage integrase SAM-like domain-containing protein [Flavobacterium sp.]|uniref:phage integrase SAM-like domain-containing protein n=1 Tax=Flavobacterium sp. TaxID=239 RepID=UPI002B4AE1AF|nr:phage integrase SAM-like domain-containing protein [Flavobacterium sp.]HLF51058.1 phage integrase SAM-like domain-containing protein [Flavobacterium sp.]